MAMNRILIRALSVTSLLFSLTALASPDAQCSGKNDFTPCHIATKPDRSYDICVNQVCVSPGCGDASCNAPGPHFPLPDTGQHSCYNNRSSIACPALPCGGGGSPAFCGQDAQYGWDATHPPTMRYVRDTSVKDNPVVRDNVTGLMWQGCAQGFYGNRCEKGTDVNLDWWTSLANCNALAWGGYKDWRLPDEYELISHVNYGQYPYEANVDPNAFPNTPADYFWTSSTRLLDDHVAWGMFLGVGYMNAEAGKIAKMYSRCVRGGPSLARSFVPSSQSGVRVVSDTLTGLTWQGCVVGLSGDKCDKGTATWARWSEALSLCEARGWRLPNIMELRSLVKNNVENPSIDTNAFPGTPGEFMWASTSRSDKPSYAWGVTFDYGSVFYYGKSDSKFGYVRCVRGRNLP